MKRVLCIGGGLFNLVLARKFLDSGCIVDIFEAKDFLGGLCADYYNTKTETLVSKFGAHILHFSEQTYKAKEFISYYTELVKYEHKVLCIGNGNFSYFPINNTYKHLYSVMNNKSDKSLELDMFNEFIKSYSTKMWGSSMFSILPSVKNRFKMKDSFNNSFFENEHVYLPKHGYQRLFTALSAGASIKYNHKINSSSIKSYISYDYIFISSAIDSFYNYKFGKLGWKGLSFTHHIIRSDNDILPTAVVNTNTHPDIIRLVEYNQLYGMQSNMYKSVVIESHSPITKHYPILNEENLSLYNSYLAYNDKKYNNVIFTGRLGKYAYTDMDDTIMEALKLYESVV